MIAFLLSISSVCSHFTSGRGLHKGLKRIESQAGVGAGLVAIRSEDSSDDAKSKVSMTTNDDDSKSSEDDKDDDDDDDDDSQDSDDKGECDIRIATNIEILTRQCSQVEESPSSTSQWLSHDVSER